jgi:hypothetical protein
VLACLVYEFGDLFDCFTARNKNGNDYTGLDENANRGYCRDRYERIFRGPSVHVVPASIGFLIVENCCDLSRELKVSWIAGIG